MVESVFHKSPNLNTGSKPWDSGTEEDIPGGSRAALGASWSAGNPGNTGRKEEHPAGPA